eukprot:8022-Heterococcus_DN1.PRE.2
MLGVVVVSLCSLEVLHRLTASSYAAHSAAQSAAGAHDIHMLKLVKQCMALSRYLLRLPHNSAFFTLVSSL